MIIDASFKDVPHIPRRALPVSVVMSTACDPSPRVDNMFLVIRVFETQESAGEDRDQVFLATSSLPIFVRIIENLIEEQKLHTC